MKTHLFKPLLALLTIGFFTDVASAAPKSNVKERGKIELSVALAPTADAPAGATASATITIDKPKFHKSATATLVLTTSGFLADSYGIDALLKDGVTSVHIGDFEVAAPATVDPVPDAPITFVIPETTDATLIASLSISNSTPAVIFEGDATETSINWQYLANVRVTGDVVAGASNGKGKGPKTKSPFGHLISQSAVKAGVETKRHFLWVAFGAPADTELTINVDGVEVGTVTSTGKGKVMFHEMPEEVVLRDVQLITLTDGTGAVVMKAQF
jgi:hypothetical protein